MTLVNYNRNPALAPYLGQQGVLKQAPLTVFDIGVSGGIDSVWRAFGEDVRAWGFDPLVAEIERLQAEAPPNHIYEAAFVGCQAYRDRYTHQDWWSPEARHNQSFPRSSAVWALDVLKMDWIKESYNANAEVRFADRMVSIDQYCADNGIADMDYLKIDTDGSDYEVLLGADHMLTKGGILGVQVEAQFHGAVHREANLFANIDTYLRERGFSLFDLDLWRYSRANLPRPFVYDMPAQTRQGQVTWGEALYLRDMGDPDYEAKWPGAVSSPEKLVKLAALFDLFNLQDCAVELLQKYAAPISAQAGPSVEDMIEAVIPSIDGKRVSYREFMDHCAAMVRGKHYRDLPQ